MKFELLININVGGDGTGAVVRVVDYVTRGPWFETWPSRRSVLP